MQENLIKNFNELAITLNRKLALSIIEAGLTAINTEMVTSSLVTLKGDILSIQGENFNLSKFKKIKVVGFGKSSAKAALAIEKILGNRIDSGAVVSVEREETKHIESFLGTHPRPSLDNVVAGNKIYEILRDSTEEDLIIVLVSGGGSALLCYGQDEYKNGVRLYDAFLGAGRTISEMNTVRKHLSMLKGGGLAKLAYPATVIGLIFSDVPGDAFYDVASGPTYKDDTTVEDATKIIKENDLGDFSLIETPKEDKYFEKVYNFVLVSNKTAVEGMKKKARDLGFDVEIVSTDLYDETEISLSKIFEKEKDNGVVLSAGEPKIKVKNNTGKGGRNLHMSLMAIEKGFIKEDSIFVSVASDGMDNSDAIGAIADMETIVSAKKNNLEVNSFLNNFDSYNFFAETNSLIFTGPTGANVSDFMILLTKK